MRICSTRRCCPVLLALMAPTMVLALETTTVSGVVRGPSGTGIERAHVMLLDPLRLPVKTADTGADGRLDFPASRGLVSDPTGWHPRNPKAESH